MTQFNSLWMTSFSCRKISPHIREDSMSLCRSSKPLIGANHCYATKSLPSLPRVPRYLLHQAPLHLVTKILVWQYQHQTSSPTYRHRRTHLRVQVRGKRYSTPSRLIRLYALAILVASKDTQWTSCSNYHRTPRIQKQALD